MHEAPDTCPGPLRFGFRLPVNWRQVRANRFFTLRVYYWTDPVFRAPLVRLSRVWSLRHA
jgi:hypothetical protein